MICPESRIAASVCVCMCKCLWFDYISLYNILRFTMRYNVSNSLLYCLLLAYWIPEWPNTIQKFNASHFAKYIVIIICRHSHSHSSLSIANETLSSGCGFGSDSDYDFVCYNSKAHTRHFHIQNYNQTISLSPFPSVDWSNWITHKEIIFNTMCTMIACPLFPYPTGAKIYQYFGW